MRRVFSFICLLGLLSNFGYAEEILVQINVNKGVHDVNENFISFSITPEALMEALNGPHSYAVTTMASQLSPAYLKMTGDYYFKSANLLDDTNPNTTKDSETTTQIIWKNFNDWTRMVGWKLVVPVPYSPHNWDAMEALRILNVSSAIGMNDCVWQLGLDFDSTRAASYVSDLVTLQTMADAFKDYVRNWKIVGADITAGSNPEETRLYVDLTKHITEAVGWMQPPGYHVEENINGYIYEKDLALKVILSKGVPTWLSLPPTSVKAKNMKNFPSIQISEGLQWAQTLGDAARYGFNVVYKPLDKDDITRPNFSYYITLLYKKIMGKKVFDAKVMNGDPFSTRLYSHCANGKSGGIAFFGINTEETRLQMLTKVSVKFTGSELWQYVLTVNNTSVHLNGKAINLNSTLEPFVKIKHPNRPMSLSLPPMSVGFWILPLANLEECQINETLENEFLIHSGEVKYRRRQSSTDSLLQKLIRENSMARKRTIIEPNRSKRDIQIHSEQSPNSILESTKTNKLKSNSSRQKRFILKSHEDTIRDNLAYFNELQRKTIKKRENNLNGFTFFQPKIPNNHLVFRRVQNRYKRQISNPIVGSFLKGSLAQSKIVPKSIASKTFVTEDKIFKTRDDVSLPEGDIHLRLSGSPDGQFDYVDFDDKFEGKFSKVQEVSENDQSKTVLPLKNNYFPTVFYEAYNHGEVVPRQEITNDELFESMNKPMRSPIKPSYKLPHDRSLDYMTHERDHEPTKIENERKFREAQENINNYYLYKLDGEQIPKQALDSPRPMTNSRYQGRWKRDTSKNLRSNRKARSTSVKDYSWQNNFIPKEFDDDTHEKYNRVTYIATPETNEIGTTNMNNIGFIVADQRKISESIDPDQIAERFPKFFDTFSTQVNALMNLLTRRVSDWWYDWA